ncbi:MAG: M2 family metallopeptidase [Thermoanaerobaculum sp.]|nr:M2 family metallopeptidase [Thermoanaerobaculum sp.]
MVIAILSLALVGGGEKFMFPLNEQGFVGFVRQHQGRVAPLEREANLAWWEAATTGKEEAYARQAELQTQLETIYTDPQAFSYLKELRTRGVVKDRQLRRQLDILYLKYLGRQLDPALLKQIIAQATAAEQKFATFRGQVNGQEVTDNQIEEVLRTSLQREERKAYWLASKQVGAALAEDVVALVKLRNQAARQLGFRDFFALQLALNEQEEGWLFRLFDQLDQLTRQPFAQLKERIDAFQGQKLGVNPAELMPWDYTDRFFQEAPNLSPLDLDTPLKDRDLVALVANFFHGIGLDPQPILARSDLFERPGKNPHAFSTDIDRQGDVRILANIKPNQYWFDTMLHELGHGVYSYYLDRSLPYFLRAEAHIFATEGVAMLFGRLAQNAHFYAALGLIDRERLGDFAPVMEEKLRAQALIFSRWCQVMLRFEKGLYENPEQDLDTLWWSLVERYQGLKRPAEAPKGTWASKIHIVSAPVYYHNYCLGDLYASQLHAALVAQLYPGQDPRQVVYVNNPKVGEFFKKRVFAPGASLPWPEFVRHSTGTELSPRAFAQQFLGPNPVAAHLPRR